MHPETTIECFHLAVDSGAEEALGRLQAFGRYWIWAQSYESTAAPLSLFEWTAHGIVLLATDEPLLHRVKAGTPHFIDGLFGYWLTSDADHQWLHIAWGSRRHYVLIAGGETRSNRRHSLGWYCQECGGTLDTMLKYSGVWGVENVDIARDAYAELAPFWNVEVDVAGMAQTLRQGYEKRGEAPKPLDAFVDLRFLEEALGP